MTVSDDFNSVGWPAMKYSGDWYGKEEGEKKLHHLDLEEDLETSISERTHIA